MDREKTLCLFLLAVLIFVIASCHARHISDIKQNMTKEEVISLWGKTDLITQQTVKGEPVEIWEYHFAGSNSTCWVMFSQDRVVSTQCRPVPRAYAYYYPPERRPGSTSAGQDLVREGSLALKLVEGLNMGEVKSEAEAESALAQIGIVPRNGWIADYPVTPEIIDELQNAIGVAADSGKLPMEKEDAIKAFQGLIAEIQASYAEPPSAEQPPPQPYSYPYPYPSYPYYYPYYPYPYSYPYPYFYFRYPFRHHWR